MFTKHFTSGVACILFIVLPACTGPDTGTPETETGAVVPPIAPVDVDALLGEWREMAKAPMENIENPRLKLIGELVAREAPGRLVEILDELVAPGASKYTTILVAASLEHVAVSSLVPRLLELVEHSDATVRACAVYVLAVVDDDAVTPALQRLRNDSNQAVKLSALLGLSYRNIEDARSAMHDMYFDETTALASRERIVLSLVTLPLPEDIPVLNHSMTVDDLSESTYIQAAAALGRLGDPSSLSSLKQRLDSGGLSAVGGDVVSNAVAAIEARVDSSPKKEELRIENSEG